MAQLLADAVEAILRLLLVPLRRTLSDTVTDAVHNALMDFAVDDPCAGGPVVCNRCGENTESGVCSECQPMAYARLP